MFSDFLNDLTSFMSSKNLDKNEIAYVNISNDYWLTPDEFFSLENPPKIWNNFSKNSMQTWDIYTNKFQVVMKDWGWVEYNECDDEFYSRFVYHEPLKRSPKKYYLTRTPHKRTLEDFWNI